MTKEFIRKPQLRHFGGSEEKALAYVQEKIAENEFISPHHFSKHWGITEDLMSKWEQAGLVKFKSTKEINRRRIDEAAKFNSVIFPLTPAFKPRTRK